MDSETERRGGETMFLVSADTVKNLCRTQQQDLRGVLRLDTSSGRRPVDLTTHRLNLEAAREAIGERVLRLLKGSAADEPLVSVLFPPTCVGGKRTDTDDTFF